MRPRMVGVNDKIGLRASKKLLSLFGKEGWNMVRNSSFTDVENAQVFRSPMRPETLSATSRHEIETCSLSKLKATIARFSGEGSGVTEYYTRSHSTIYVHEDGESE
ncbi:hypothetical protein D5086_008558 [Populus alba]|uniref:Uncharacterized protein n=1 Tax=Populus alba TaxID=43335 RepID=A0ACC4CGF5_POPAL